jgi:hypothetical protein
MSVSCEWRLLSCRGVCDGLLTRLEASYRVSCVLSVVVKPGQRVGHGLLGTVESGRKIKAEICSDFCKQRTLFDNKQELSRLSY